MRILVLGGAGFIGGNLAKQLAFMGAAEVLVLDDLHRSYSCDSLPTTVEFRRSDMRDLGAAADALNGSEIVFHLAVQSNVMEAVTDAGYSFSTNVVGTYSVLQLAAGPVETAGFPSSREVYTNPGSIAVPESTPLPAKNGYGASKIAGEICCRLAA